MESLLTNEFDKRLSEALHRAGHLKGITEYDEEYGLIIRASHIDDYLVVLYLAQLLENNQMEVRITPSKIEYLYKLLHMKE